MKIQFFGAKQDSDRVREAFSKMVERGRVADVTLAPSSLVFREEAVLQIQVCTRGFGFVSNQIVHKIAINLPF